MSTDELAARRLRESYAALRAAGYIGGSSVLYALQRDAAACFKSQDNGPLRFTAWVLAVVFGRLAKDQGERALSASEAAALFAALDQPLAVCLDALCGKRPLPDLFDTLVKLNAAYAKLPLDGMT